MNETDPLIRRLAEMNPILEAERPLGPAAEELLGRITSGGQPPRLRPGTALRLLVATGVVASVVAWVLVVRVGERAPATAAEALNAAAVVAEDAEATGGEGPYVYARTQAEQLTTSGQREGRWSAIQALTEETWIAPDGSGRVRTVFGDLRFPGPRDEARWRASGAPVFPSGTSDDEFSAGVLSYEDLGSLPVDPEELLTFLRNEVASEGIPGDAGVFLRIGQLLSRGDAPPELRAGLYLAAASLEGIELIGEVTDPAGRAGIGVGMTYEEMGASVQIVMIFDEETSELLAQTQTLLQRAPWVDAEPGTRLSYISYLASARTGSAHETPAPGTP